jgi:uncharacterized protein YyaL (SSP411 family)
MSTRHSKTIVLVMLLAVSACTRSADKASSGVLVERANGTIRYTNRLIREKSPYLQLHAHNPVDWYPWGAEAFDRAKRENKPIFLSIGYSTCHWCHVMETESFSVLAEKTRRNGRATIYICKSYACRMPTNDPAVAARLLDEP